MIKQSIILFALLFAMSNTVIAENRIALVIGNSNYVTGENLPNDINDARDMTEILQQYGFKVILKTDVDLSGMMDVMEEFKKELEKGGVGLFYYSGHGLEVDGQQYIVPIDAQVKRKIELPKRMIVVNDILNLVGDSKSQLNIIILDACRNNPFSKALGLKSSSIKGFSPIPNPPNGTIIASSTAVGKISLGGINRNSVYTEQLLKLLHEEPNEEIRLLLGDVGTAVKKTTNNEQIPWVGGYSMEGRFYFIENKSNIVPSIPAIRIETKQNEIDNLYSNKISQFKFGSSPEVINRQLTPPFGTVSWDSLPKAKEYDTVDARYFMRPLSEFTDLPFQDMYSQCNSDGSYLLFMFNTKGLFNISLRLSDKCPVSRNVIEQIASTYGLDLVPNGNEVEFKYKGEKIQLYGGSSSNSFSVIDWSPIDSAYPPSVIIK